MNYGSGSSGDTDWDDEEMEKTTSEEEDIFDGNLFDEKTDKIENPKELQMVKPNKSKIQAGVENDEFDTIDTVLISIWDVSGHLMRYRRI